jgi:hypothetical protein
MTMQRTGPRMILRVILLVVFAYILWRRFH